MNTSAIPEATEQVHGKIAIYTLAAMIEQANLFTQIRNFNSIALFVPLKSVTASIDTLYLNASSGLTEMFAGLWHKTIYSSCFLLK